MNFPIITKTIQQEYERQYAAAPSGMPMICGYYGRACRQLEKTEGANRAACQRCPLAAYASGTHSACLLSTPANSKMF